MFILDSSNGQSNVIVDLFLVFIANYGSHRLEIYLCHKCWLSEEFGTFFQPMILMKLMKDVPGASEKSENFFKDSCETAKQKWSDLAVANSWFLKLVQRAPL